MLWTSALALGRRIFLAAASFIGAPTPNRDHLGLKVVVTGSSRGLGYALADTFLSLGDDVVIASRSAELCTQAAGELQRKHPGRSVACFACDVQNPEEMEALADFAVKEMGRCDVWVNNAGVSQPVKAKLDSVDAALLKDIVGTNLLGAMYGSRAAMRVMREQTPPGGKIFMLDGRGARGEATPQSAAYGASKCALPQLVKSLSRECRGSGVAVHITSPGMVITDLLVNDSNRHQRGFVRIMNILADMPHTVAEWMVPRMRGVTGTGKYFRYLTAFGVLWRFATAWLNSKDRLLKMPPPKDSKSQ